MGESNIENNSRIAKNTLLLYGRMMFSMIVSLYSTRLLLDALGEVDYGLHNVVAGFVIMFSIISGTLSASVSRFITFELGRNDHERLQKVFSTSLQIHIFMALLLVLILETLGLWFLNQKMTIPPDRLYAIQWVYHTSVISLFISIIGVPYDSVLIAHERMNIYAYLGIVQVLLHLALVLFLAYAPFSYDRLIVYGVCNIIIGVLLQTYRRSYSKKHFAEVKLSREFDPSLLKSIGSFAGWNFIGSLAGMLNDQGINILINLFFGPTLNAARGIAGSVNGAVVKFSSSFGTAIRPQITKSYAAGQKEYLFSLVHRGSRFSYYAMFIFALPVFIEAETLLSLWLKEVPAHTVTFSRLYILFTMVDILSGTLITLQSATGKIRDYQIVVGGVLLLNFPLSYLCLRLGYPAESTIIVAIFIAILCLILRLWFLRKMAGLSMRGFLKNVVLKVAWVTILSSVTPLLLFYFTQEITPLVRLAITTSTSLISAGLTILFAGCSQNERSFIISKFKQFLNKAI